MRLYDDDSHYTTIKDTEEIADAADRLVRRRHPGHFAHRAVGWGRTGSTFTAEVCRGVEGLTEHCGRMTFRLVR